MKHLLQEVAIVASLMLIMASHKAVTDAFMIAPRHVTSFPKTSLPTNDGTFSKHASIHNLQPNIHTAKCVRKTLPRSSSLTYRQSSTELNGIPKMFRWLTDQYPNINSRLSEGLSSDKVVDNFYLDMNGIIHPCTHGNNNDEIIVLDETAMFKKIFGYVDR